MDNAQIKLEILRIIYPKLNIQLNPKAVNELVEDYYQYIKKEDVPVNKKEVKPKK